MPTPLCAHATRALRLCIARVCRFSRCYPADAATVGNSRSCSGSARQVRGLSRRISGRLRPMPTIRTTPGMSISTMATPTTTIRTTPIRSVSCGPEPLRPEGSTLGVPTFSRRWNAHGKILPCASARGVASMRGQWRYFRQRFPQAFVVLQVGNRIELYGSDARRVARWPRPGWAPDEAGLAWPLARCAQVLNELSRHGLAWIYADERAG